MSELQNRIWKVLLKETKKENLKCGDHIYTWTQANTKAERETHPSRAMSSCKMSELGNRIWKVLLMENLNLCHGIYLNEKKVIHFTQGRRGERSDDHYSACRNCSDHDQSSHGVVSSCIDCFLSGGNHPYLFEYGAKPTLILTKLAGGATLAPADPAEDVKNRASSFLLNNRNDPSGHYRFINNGKDFAMYCKTGLLVIDNINFRRSWQAAAIFLAVAVTFFLFLQQITAATFTGVIATCFGIYCIYRFGSDIGARPNVIKVDRVKNLPDVDKKLSSAASGFRPIQSVIDLSIVLLMTYFNIQLSETLQQLSKPLQQLSKTPQVVWILACIILFYLAILQKRLLSNKIHKKQLKPGDHIYAWRSFSYRAHAHHGIYVGDTEGDREVIHLIRGGDPYFPSSSSTRTIAERTHVGYCSLDSFLDGDELYLYKYGVSLAFFIAKTRGGTCTLGSADPPSSVLYRADQRLQRYDAYNLINNNCEDFAIHCKTGLPLRKGIINHGRSGQIASFFGVFCAIIIFILTFLTHNPIRVVATVYFIYSMFRFVADATRCPNAYQVRLTILPRWSHHGWFWVKPQFMSLEDEILLF